VLKACELIRGTEDGQPTSGVQAESPSDILADPQSGDPQRRGFCPICGTGKMVLVEILKPTPGGRTWDRTKVRRILLNELYVGTLVYNRTTQKLKTPTRHNPKTEWIRTAGAFRVQYLLGGAAVSGLLWYGRRMA